MVDQETVDHETIVRDHDIENRAIYNRLSTINVPTGSVIENANNTALPYMNE